MSLLRKHPHLAEAPPCPDLHTNSLPVRPHLLRPKKTKLKLLYQGETSLKEVRYLQFVRFCSSSNQSATKAEAPIGIVEEARFNWSSIGRHVGQSFNQLSRHINVYFKRKDVVCLAENACVVVTTPDYLGRSQRRGQSQRAARERKVSEGKDAALTLKCKDVQEDSETSSRTRGSSGMQLFHPSSLATTFGESYSYVANHINSVFFRGSAKAQKQEENLETTISTRGINRRKMRRKIQNSCVINPQQAEDSQVKLGTDQGQAELNNASSSWEEGYLHFARHINRYFGAKVADERAQPLSEKRSSYHKQFPTQTTSNTQGAGSQLKTEKPITPQAAGLFHSSPNTTDFGENYFQTAGHINQYFKGQSEFDEELQGNLSAEIGPVSVTSERLKTTSFMDCLRHPTSAIPDLLGAYLKKGTHTQVATTKPAMASPQAILSKTVSL